MTKYLISILMVLAFYVSRAGAQSENRELDSLEAVLKSGPDSLLPKTYCRMSSLCRDNNPIKAIDYALKSIDAAMSQNNQYYIVMGYTNLAMSEKNSGMTEASLEHFQTAADYAVQFNMTKLAGHCFNNLARTYLELNDLDNGQFYVQKAIEIADQLGDSLILAYSYLDMGILCEKQDKTELAVGYLMESYKIRAGSGDIYSSESYIPMWHLADIYASNCEYTKAKDLIYITIRNPKIQKLHDFMSRIWYMLSQIYYTTGMLDSAEYAGLQAYSEGHKCLSMRRMENSCKLLDSIYLAKGSIMEAADICRSYMSICDTVFNKQLGEQLVRIQFSSEYMENKKSIDQQLSLRRTSMIWLVVAMVALLGGISFILVLILRNRKIRQLNSDLVVKRKSLERGLRYASAIQMAVQSDIASGNSVFSDSMLLYIPRDIVSGDFFWSFTDSRYEMIAVADCTGHGVPGALLTMLGTSMLQDMATSGMRNSGEILNELRRRIKFMLGVNVHNRMQDGMDISLAIIDRQNMSLDFAGAYNSLWYIRSGEIMELKATRCPIGEYIVEKSFVSQYIDLFKGDIIFMMTDGYTSQFGGPDNSKISQRILKSILLEYSGKSMEDLRKFLSEYFHDWKGQCDQLDDVAIAAFRL